jgi:Reverse transcriptase (RNA-dependent DNA polymerase)
MTPYEAWHGNKPDISMLRIFGCRAYVHIPRDSRPGLQSHTRRCGHLGIEDRYKGWHCYDPVTRQTVISRDIIFDELDFPGLRTLPTTNTWLPPPPQLTLPETASSHPEVTEIPDDQSDHTPTTEQSVPETYNEEDIALPPPTSPAPNQPRRSSQNTRTNPQTDYQLLHDPYSRPRTQRGHDDPTPEGGVNTLPQVSESNAAIVPLHEGLEIAYNATVKDERVPCTYAEAMSHPNADEWCKATDAEIQAQLNNGTWELVELPAGEKTIGCRWVFHIKLNSDGSIERYKVCLVAKGYNQRRGIDFDEIFAPTACWATLHTILAQGAISGTYIESIDISNAYLNRVLDGNVTSYMDQPEGYRQGRPNQVG